MTGFLHVYGAHFADLWQNDAQVAEKLTLHNILLWVFYLHLGFKNMALAVSQFGCMICLIA